METRMTRNRRFAPLSLRLSFFVPFYDEAVQIGISHSRFTGKKGRLSPQRHGTTLGLRSKLARLSLCLSLLHQLDSVAETPATITGRGSPTLSTDREWG